MTSASSPYESGDVTVESPRARVRAVTAGALWSLLAPVVFVAVGKTVGGGGGGGPPSWAAPVLLALLASGAVGAALAYRTRGPRAAKLRIADANLVVTQASTERTILASGIDSGIVVPTPPGERLELRLIDGELLVVRFPGASGAAAALEALRLDPSHRRTRLQLYRPAERALALYGGGVLGGLAWLPFAGIAAEVLSRFHFGSSFDAVLAIATLVPFLLAGAAFIARRLPEVTIGADGITTKWNAAKKRFTAAPTFIPFDRVAGVSTGTRSAGRMRVRTVSLDIVGESPIVVAELAQDDEAQAVALVGRIQQALDARSSAARASTGTAQLERGSATVGQWLAALRGLATRAADYRKDVLSRERLLELVEDATTPALHRLGAAVVLASAGDEDNRQRIRVAADTTASPRVRVALEALATGEASEEVIASALEEEAAVAAVIACPPKS